MQTTKFAHLEADLERLMAKYVELYGELMASEDVRTAADVAQSMPLNLFLYSLHALTHTLVEFETQFSKKNFTARYRARNFVVRAVTSVCQRTSYDLSTLWFSLRTTFGVVLGVFLSAYVFRFSSSVPNAIAMVANNHIGKEQHSIFSSQTPSHKTHLTGLRV